MQPMLGGGISDSMSVDCVQAAQPPRPLENSPIRRNEAVARQGSRDDQAVCGIGMEVCEPYGSDTDFTIDGDLYHARFQMLVPPRANVVGQFDSPFVHQHSHFPE